MMEQRWRPRGAGAARDNAICVCETPFSIRLRFVLPPMSILARWIEHPLDVPVQCPHNTDAREHRWAAERRHQDQGFHRGLPFRRFVFCLWQLGDVGAGVLQRDERSPVRQLDWVVKFTAPACTL